MPLEATMIIIDNSEYMRNGDYMPTRFAAQADAVNVVFQTKIDSNPENTVGIMTMAGRSPEVLVTHTKEHGHILGGVHSASKKIGGSIDLPTTLNVAQLALKHRENKNLRQRVIVFTASPLETDQDTMVKLARKLKKNNVAVDIVVLGDAIGEDCGETVLRAFVENVNSTDNSHLLVVPPGNHLLSDALISSPILSADRSAAIPEELGGTGAGPSGPGPAPSNDFEFGVDPSLDPELAMALRMSMQEAQAREAAQAAASGATTSAPSTTTPAAPTGPQPTVVPSQRGPHPGANSADDVDDDEDEDDEDEELQAALALSKASTSAAEEDEDEDEDEDVEMEDDDEGDEDDEDEEDDDEIQKAIQMSLQKPGAKK
ncbi:hypothetical protein CPB83DRAFT_850040 [Crepidotus variabilis]|uniref:VWFA domain-containing protein n=1 Tax=Crepidotus variabilis TaxID=179855 RepID=A0A9P6EKX1_9AGAR|nr:hypothetical protein CPB83DRAFT_850040 [Crepidotus variabilis]